MTLLYRAEKPHGYSRSRFCKLYHDWARRLAPVMRQTHRAGEKLFVDYAGTTIPVRDAGTGEVREAQLFVTAHLVDDGPDGAQRVLRRHPASRSTYENIDPVRASDPRIATSPAA